MSAPNKNEAALRRRSSPLVRALAALVASSLVASSSAGAAVRPERIDVGAGTLVASTTGTEVASGSRLFLEKDGAGHRDSVHLYAGFANDPVNLRDPTGDAIFLPLLWLATKLAIAGAAGGAIYSAAEQGLRIAEDDALTSSDFSWGAVGRTAAWTGALTPAVAATLWVAPGAAPYLVGLAGFGAGYAASGDIASGNYLTAGFTLGTGVLGSAGLARGAAASRAAFGFVDDAARAGVGAFAREASTVAGLPQPSMSLPPAVNAVLLGASGGRTGAPVVAGGAQKLLPAPKLVKHHIFNKFRGSSPASQKYRDFFARHGVEVDRWTVEVPEGVHKTWIHGEGRNWTTVWKRWIDTNPDATTRDVYQQAGRMMDEYGLSGRPLVPYR